MGNNYIRSAIDFETYIEKNTQNFTGRKWVFSKINEWIEGTEKSRFFLLTGAPGSGKTAIAAMLVLFSEGITSPPEGLTRLGPNFLSAFHFCSSADYQWTDPFIFAGSLASQLANRYPQFLKILLQDKENKEVHINVKQEADNVSGKMIGVIINVSGPSPAEAFVSAIRNPLETLIRDGFSGEIVILVDGLDEAILSRDRMNIVQLLSHTKYLPNCVRFILSSNPNYEILRSLRRNVPTPIECSLTSEEGQIQSKNDIYGYAMNTLSNCPSLAEKLAVDLTNTNFAEIVRDKSQGNFLYAKYLLNMLVKLKSKISRESLDQFPVGLDAIYIEFLEKLIDEWEEKYATILGILAVSRQPLIEGQLALFMKKNDSEIRVRLTELRQLLDTDERRPFSQRTYNIFHKSFADLLLDRDRAQEFWCDALKYNKSIACHYLKEENIHWHDCDIYGLKYLPTHLAAAGMENELKRLLLDFSWIRAKLDRTGIYALISDYNYLPAEEDVRSVQGAINLSAHALSSDLGQLQAQLVGRLLWNKSEQIQALMEQILKSCHNPWLRPLTPSLIPPGGPLVRILKGHTDSIIALAMTPDGKMIVSGSYDNTLRIWDLETGTKPKTFLGPDLVLALAVTPDGKRVVSGSRDNTVIIWDLDKGEIIKILEGHTSSVDAVAVAPDGKMAVSASSDGIIKVWDLDTKKEIKTLSGSPDWIKEIALTPNGRNIISMSSLTSTIKVWNIDTGKENTLEAHSGLISGVALIPDGKRAILKSNDGTLGLWDLDTIKEIKILKGDINSGDKIAVTPDGRRAVLAGSYDNLLRVWDLETGKEIRTLEGHTFSNRITAVAVTPDGRRAVSAGLYDNLLRVWDLDIKNEEAKRVEDGRGLIITISVILDGEMAISVYADNTFKLWKLEPVKEIRARKVHTKSPITAAAITSEGKMALLGSFDGTLNLCSLETGKVIKIIKGHTDLVIALAITRDEQKAVSGSWDKKFKFWNLGSGKEIFEDHTIPISAVAITPDGKTAVSGSEDNLLKVWDLETGREIKTLEGHTAPIETVAVISNGNIALSGSVDKTLKLWNLEMNKEIRTFEGHIGSVRSIAATPDGKIAVSGSYDNTLRVWDLKTGNTIMKFTGDGPITAIAITPNKLNIIAGESSGRIHFLRWENKQRDTNDACHSTDDTLNPCS